MSVVDDNDHTKNRYFANNAQGQAMVVVQGDLQTAGAQNAALAGATSGTQMPGAAWHRFYFANGQNVGSVGRLTPGGTGGTGRANFDVNYTPLDHMVAKLAV